MSIQNDEKSAQVELRSAKGKLHNLQQEANDDLPAGLAGFEAAKEVSYSADFLRDVDFVVLKI